MQPFPMRVTKWVSSLFLVGLLACGGSDEGSNTPDAATLAGGTGGSGSGTRGGMRVDEMNAVDGGGGATGGSDGGAAAGGSGGGGPGNGGAGGRDAGRDSSPDVMTLAPDAATPDAMVDRCAAGGICSLLEGEYAGALARAKSCAVGKVGQCGVMAPSGLGCPGCNVWVNGNTELLAISKRYEDAGCGNCRRLCPLIRCLALSKGACQSKPLTTNLSEIVPIPLPLAGSCVNVQ